ncbi:MAG: DUF302 domain-containing protein [gamma proteobacterium symbiont of Bathyaustriella thionipta]|nr:DUF302 domain-containing protein [gamma proteobacterium symbiont of Bathyaustriella thionipta]MCU7950719.1 DUF302 domain-containing protein [gamma proteobacterium symbiont of Bathyaustriella thionipta]MCU7953282.1 DUF302 domain-containing protein [gamma proteobacterium symbiont of Bathyaustriella thionipta]MCU7957211.1 DUF302 domain-containing protein [gamma proteobacterium symbiont of Bathyaustriella thionipta]
MNKMKEMMNSMNPEMKEKCMDMMGSMAPDIKQQCMDMMQSMMSDNENCEDDKNNSLNLVFTHKASNDFKTIEDRIEEDAKAIGLGLKKVYPFSVNLPEQQGLEINEAASVYELCMPSLAADLLNTQPELNVLMPCRISLYEKQGEVFVSTPDLEVQLDALGCQDELKTGIIELYKKMIEMIKSW